MYIQWMPKVVNRSLWYFATCHYYFWKHIIQIPTASPHGLCCINTIPWCNHWGDWLPFYAPPPQHEQHLQCSPCLSSSDPRKPGCGEYGSLWDHRMVWVSIPETHAKILDSCDVMKIECNLGYHKVKNAYVSWGPWQSEPGCRVWLWWACSVTQRQSAVSGN